MVAVTNKVGEAFIELRAKRDKLSSDMNAAESLIKKSTTSMESNFSRLTTSALSSGRSFLTFGTIAGTSVTAALAGVARSVINTQKEFDGLQMRLKRATGSAEEYAKAQSYISETANSMNAEIKTVGDTYTRMLALERGGTITKEQTKQLTEGIIDAAAAYGASGSQIENVLYGMSQALGQGVVQAQELNQVIEPMPGFINDLAAAAGTSAYGFKQMVVQGKITSETFGVLMVKAFERSAGAAKGMTDTATGAAIRLNNAFTELKLTISESFVLDGFSGLLAALTSTLKVINDILAGSRAIVNEMGNIGLVGQTDNQQRIAAKKDDIAKLQSTLSGGMSKGTLNKVQQQQIKDLIFTRQMELVNLTMKEQMAQDPRLRGVALDSSNVVRSPVSKGLSGTATDIKSGASSAKDAVKELNDELDDVRKKAADDVSGAFESMFDTIITGSGDAGDALRSLASDLLKVVYQQTIGKDLSSGLSGLVGGLFDNIIPTASHAVGGYINNDMVTKVHKGEVIVPASQVNNMGSSTYNIDARGASAGVEERIRQVMIDMNKMRNDMPAVAVSSVRQAQYRGAL